MPKRKKTDDITQKKIAYSTKSALKGKIRLAKYQIPKSKFKAAIELVNSPKNWNTTHVESNCLTPVHLFEDRKYELIKNPSAWLLNEARKCILRRDWKNLIKILSVANPEYRAENVRFFSTFLKYAVVCLLHQNNSDLLDRFLQGVASCSSANEKIDFLEHFASL